MTKDELALLLTCARVLRAQLKEIGSSWADEDIQALNEALAPWDGAPGEPKNQAATMRTPATSAVPEFCHDCGQTFGPNDRRLLLGDRKYHAETCGPMPEMLVRVVGEQTTKEG